MKKLTSLHPHYGVHMHDVDLSKISARNGYRELRSAFEQHSLLYFSGQCLNDTAHLKLGELFGPKEDRSIDPKNPLPDVSPVSNVISDNSLAAEDDLHLLQLQSNFLWHTDSTFLPVPALANILVARVIPSSGGATEFASTRVAWEQMPESLKARARGKFFKHRYGHSRRKVSKKLAREQVIAHWKDQIWNSIWTNPVNHKESLYIASHACEVIGMELRPGLALIEELIDWCTQQHFVYSHQWQVGDVLIWDERAMLHRGTPWLYDQERSLSSICISVVADDGFEKMRFQGQTNLSQQITQ